MQCSFFFFFFLSTIQSDVLHPFDGLHIRLFLTVFFCLLVEAARS